MAGTTKQKESTFPTTRKFAGGDEQQNPSLKTPKAKTTKTKSSKGRFNDLPISILEHILSFLPVKDAIKVCCLSREWDSLWTSIPNLLLLCESKEDEVLRFAASVDKILKAYASSKIKFFSLKVPHWYLVKDQIYSWLQFATSRGVEEITLHMPDYICGFPEVLCTNHTVYKMSLISFYFDGCDNFCWTSLKVLSLTKTYLEDDNIRSILGESPLIECLTLRKCIFLGGKYDAHRIDVTNCTRLKELVIDGCFNFAARIEIIGPNLVSLTVVGYIYNTTLELSDVSCLTEANFGFWMELTSYTEHLLNQKKMVEDLLRKLGHVNKLTIGTWLLQVLSVMKMNHEIFRKSTRKVLIINMKLDKKYLLGTAALLQSSQYLEQLIINITSLDHIFNPAELLEDEMPAENYWRSECMTFECFNQHLKSVKIMGFVVGSSSIQNKIFIELVEFILANANLLQNLTLEEQADNGSAPSKSVNKLLQVTEKILSYSRASPNAKVEFKNQFQAY